jgi:cyanophycinase-like exopeptidase
LLLAVVAAIACIPQLSGGAGHYARTQAALHGPGLLLDGGGQDVAAAWKWMHDVLAGNAVRRGGNVLVITAEPDTAYDTWAMQQAAFASVRTLYIPSCASRAAIDKTARIVNGSDAVFFEGGDQAHYVPWKGTRFIAAIKGLYARGGVVGGTSAGLAIQGQVIFDSVAADRVLPDDQDVATPDAVRNPYEPAISFTTGFFSWPALRDTITDTHFAKRNRFGRLVAFMARIVRDRLVPSPEIYGFGIDEGSAVVVDRRGIATLLKGPDRGYHTLGAYVIRGASARRVMPGAPLLYTVDVTHLFAQGSRYDLIRKRGAGVAYRITIDGSKSSPYSKNPYKGSRNRVSLQAGPSIGDFSNKGARLV